MNTRKPVDYSAMFAALDKLVTAGLPQMELYCEMGRLVSSRPEKGAAVAAAEYLHSIRPAVPGFSPRNLRRMRDFYRAYEGTPEVLDQALTIGWTQNVVILEAELTAPERAWYIRAVRWFGWSKAELQRQIGAGAHEGNALDFEGEICYTEEKSTGAKSFGAETEVKSTHRCRFMMEAKTIKMDTTSVFEQALQTDALVYLFGTGISSALTGRKYGWSKWIMDGIRLLKDTALAKALEASLKADPSAHNMIAVAGDVIQTAKADGVYDRWMRQSFEANPISHGTLPATLKKLLLAQDVFATTNYDLLLEKATGLGTLTYEQPDLIFPMLEEKRSTHILHIHGVYDSARGIDNIVASQEQYRRVLDDRGAQFIQNILGTRTLILVGCGKTTEDANIAQFLRFAEEWLKLNRPCYFLYNTTQQFDDMPEYITMVPYGDCNDDLPPFLERMAQIRLRAKIRENPIVSRTAYFGPKTDAYGLAEYHFANESLKFCGRSRELARLEVFAENDAPVKWWAVTGQAGAGKSRLAYEFLRRDRAGYFSFFLNCDAPIEAAQQFRPFNNTFVIVDYVKGHELRIAEMTSILMERFDGTPYKLRLLFLERDNQLLTGSWHQALEASFGVNDRARFRDCEYNAAIASREHRFLYLEDLEEDAVVELIGEIFRRKGLPADPNRCSRLKEEYRKRYERLKFRPLFLQLFVETYIDNGCVQADYRDSQELLQAVLRREQERILHSVNDDRSVCAALLRLLVRAGIPGRLETDALPARYQRDWEAVKRYNAAASLPGVQRKEQLYSLIRDAGQELDPGAFAIAPLYPDVIKEAMFLYYVDEEEMPEVWAELWENCPAEFAEFLNRAVMDFPDHAGLRTMIRRASADYTNLYAMEARLALLQNETVRTVEEGPELLRQVQEEFAYWRGAPSGGGGAGDLIALKGLDFSARQLIGWTAGEAQQALADIAGFPCTRSTSVYQINSLLEHTHYFVEKSAGASQYAMELTEPLIDALPKDRRKTLLWLRLQRERAVTQIQNHQAETAWETYEKISAAVTKTDEQMMELYAYAGFSCAWESFRMLDHAHVLDYSYELQDMAAAYASGAEHIAFNDKIHYYYLHAKLLQCECVTLSSALCGLDEIGLHDLDGLIQEIEGNEMIADFSGLLVGAWALKVGADKSVSDGQARTYLASADEFLQRYPDNQVLAAKTLDLWETAYTHQFRQKVPAPYVERAYMLLLRFPRDPAVIDGFHDLLAASEEARDAGKYYSRREVVAGVFENHREDYLLPASPEETTTYVRDHPKVGANDPCPCGSGKKFKKCCRGNGRYD